MELGKVDPELRAIGIKTLEQLGDPMSHVVEVLITAGLTSAARTVFLARELIENEIEELKQIGDARQSDPRAAGLSKATRH